MHLDCWTHCRRYFLEALQALPSYQVEAQARRDEVDGIELGHQRRQDSVPVLADIEALLLANTHAVLPKSLLGRGLHYLASQWSKLRRYVEDGRYSIDRLRF